MHIQTRYPRVTIWAHWLSLLAILAATALALLRGQIEDHDTKTLLLLAHSQLGILIWILTLLRLSMRRGAPPAYGEGPQRLVAQLTHGLLYLLLIALPVIGAAAIQARGKPLTLMGLVPLPALLERDRDLSETLSGIHETAAWALLALAGLHAAAALWHQYIRKDGILERMRPQRAVEIASR